MFALRDLDNSFFYQFSNQKFENQNTGLDEAC